MVQDNSDDAAKHMRGSVEGLADSFRYKIWRFMAMIKGVMYEYNRGASAVTHA